MIGRRPRAALVAVLAVAFLAASASSASAACTAGLCHVTTNADGNVAGTLRFEINAAVDTDIVEIDAGVNPAIDGTMGQITIDDDITLRGQGAATTMVQVTTSTTQSRAFTVAIGTTATIEKLKILGGQAPDGTTPGPGPTAGTDGENGGAILNAGTLTLDHVEINNNVAGSAGAGGPGVAGSTPTNGGNGGHGGEGAGVYSDGSLTIKDSSLFNNLGGDGGAGGVGGLDTDMGGTGGTGGNGGSAGRGGGVLAIGTLNITNSTITDNVAGEGGDGGSGGNAVGGGPCPIGCGTGGGPGLGGGGGGLLSSATTTLLNSTFEGNSTGAGGDGGFGPSMQQEGADGGSGGGIQAGGGNPLGGTHLTIANNEARESGNGATPNPGQGGGIFVISGTTTLTNTLLDSNQAQGSSLATANCGGTVVNGGQNIAFNGGGCPLFITGDPLLGDLLDNGGPTETMAIGFEGAAADGVPAMGASCAATDQRGVTRPQPIGSGCDIGAYELVPRTLTVSLGGGGGGSVTATGINCGLDCSETYANGTMAVLTATPAAGSSFGGWTGCDTPSGNSCTMDMTADKAVTASFTLDPIPPVIIPPALTPATPTTTTPPPARKKCKKGFKLKRGKCKRKKKK